jgi:hypothetical protein
MVNFSIVEAIVKNPMLYRFPATLPAAIFTAFAIRLQFTTEHTLVQNSSLKRNLAPRFVREHNNSNWEGGVEIQQL